MICLAYLHLEELDSSPLENSPEIVLILKFSSLNGLQALME